MGATALVAILFTDLVGSTEAASRLGEEGAEGFRQTHFALLREGIRDLRSTMVNGQTIWWGPAAHDLGLLATLLGRYEEAEAYFADAVERQDRMGSKGTVVHTRIAWAEMLRRRNGP